MSRHRDEVLRWLSDRAPDLAGPLVVCIDGRAGTGKSTLAAAIAAGGGPDSVVIHVDDLCPGWAGLPEVPALLAALVEPLSAGRPGTYPRYDWIAGRVAGTVTVDPRPLVVVEGVGAGARALRPFRTVLVWMEAAEGTRRERALDRDGDTFAPYWDAWAAAEETYLATDADRDGADLILGS